MTKKKITLAESLQMMNVTTSNGVVADVPLYLGRIATKDELLSVDIGMLNVCFVQVWMKGTVEEPYPLGALYYFWDPVYPPTNDSLDKWHLVSWIKDPAIFEIDESTWIETIKSKSITYPLLADTVKGEIIGTKDTGLMGSVQDNEDDIGSINLVLGDATKGLVKQSNDNKTAIALNTAKVGITPEQSSAITANTAKVGISTEQASAITANTAKVGITTQQATDITTNNGKTGITPEQSSAITANTAKVGISTEQASAITANTAKVGITPAQATAISTSTTDIGTNKTAIALNTAKVGITTEQASAITANTAKVGISTEQASAITANTAKVGITPAQATDITTNNTKVGITPTQATDITTNNSKIGITTEQASAITANTAKVGISTGQASAIIANTAKTGITTEQSDAITANTAKTGITTEQASAIIDNTAKPSGAAITKEISDALLPYLKASNLRRFGQGSANFGTTPLEIPYIKGWQDIKTAFTMDKQFENNDWVAIDGGIQYNGTQPMFVDIKVIFIPGGFVQGDMGFYLSTKPLDQYIGSISEGTNCFVEQPFIEVKTGDQILVGQQIPGLSQKEVSKISRMLILVEEV